MNSKIKELVNVLDEYGRTISCVETFTGGMFSSEITNIYGAAKVFKQGFVGFTNQFKNSLGVSKNKIKRHGPHSREVAVELAYNSKNLINSDICVSFVGNPYPTYSTQKEYRYCEIAIVLPNGKCISFNIDANKFSNIERLKQFAIECVADQIIEAE
ncbi:nicotinamide-nucleotide amidohydrolase family protein [Vibrio harveyi]|nr:nicotinamide-nucleotide amidohydrolase family protein [Vibrio harveyi]